MERKAFGHYEDRSPTHGLAATREAAMANPSLHQRERDESRLAIRGNPENRICKETARRAPKTGKFDYLNAPNHPSLFNGF
jgi:hypothetical protein